MSVPTHLYASPIRFAAASYVLRVTCNSNTQDLPFPASGSLDTETDYWMVDDSSSSSVLRMLELAIEAHPETPALAVGLQLLPTSTRVLCTSNQSIDVLWTHVNTTLDPDVFGFNATASGTEFESNYMPRGLWRPRMAAAFDSRDRQPHVGGVTTALSGRMRAVEHALPAKVRDLRYRHLLKQVSLTEYAAALEPYNTFEELTACSQFVGRPVRLYPDETDRGTSDFTLYWFRDFEDSLEIMQPPRHTRWQTELRLSREPT